MPAMHAPFTRRPQRTRQQLCAAPETDTRPLNEIALEALLAGEDRLTRIAQDERDIQALIKLRAAIQRLRQ